MLRQGVITRFEPFAPSPWRSRFTLGQAVRCWPTDNGGAVCDNLLYYAPKCEKTPPITETEVLSTPAEASAAT